MQCPRKNRGGKQQGFCPPLKKHLLPARRDDWEGRHHVHVFMFENVTMINVVTCRRAKLHHNAGDESPIGSHHVFPTHFIDSRRNSVTSVNDFTRLIEMIHVKWPAI